METKELSDIYRTLGRLIEAIKAYDKFTSTEYGEEIISLCSILWNNKNFSGAVFSDYIEGLNKEPYYVKAIAKHIKEAIGLGIDYYHLGILRGLDKKEYFYQFGGWDVEEEFQYWRHAWGDFQIMCNELDQEAKEILEIYDYVFQNSKTDETESNKKVQEELTDREIKYYEKAIGAGMAEKTEQGYRWLYNGGSNVSFGYFINKVHRPNSTERLPYKRMEKLWNFKRLDSAIYQSVDRDQKWKKDIDALFEE